MRMQRSLFIIYTSRNPRAPISLTLKPAWLYASYENSCVSILTDCTTATAMHGGLHAFGRIW